MGSAGHGLLGALPLGRPSRRRGFFDLGRSSLVHSGKNLGTGIGLGAEKVHLLLGIHNQFVAVVVVVVNQGQAFVVSLLRNVLPLLSARTRMSNNDSHWPHRSRSRGRGRGRGRVQRGRWTLLLACLRKGIVTVVLGDKEASLFDGWRIERASATCTGCDFRSHHVEQALFVRFGRREWGGGDSGKGRRSLEGGVLGAQQFQRIGVPGNVLLQSLGVVEIPVDSTGLLLLLLVLVLLPGLGLRLLLLLLLLLVLLLLVGLQGRGNGGCDVCRGWWQ